MSNNLANIQSIQNTLNKEETASKIVALLGSEDKKNRFIALAVNMAKNLDLSNQTNQLCFFNGLNALAELKLMPLANINYGYFIAYGGKLDFQLGYRAFVELLGRANINVRVQEVRALDIFIADPAQGKLIHEIKSFERGSVIGYYAYSMEKGIIELLSKEEAESIRQKSSKAPNSPAWKNYFDEMAKKIVIKRFFKRVGGLDENIQTIETFTKAEEIDNTQFTFEPKEIKEKREAISGVDLGKEPIDVYEDGGFFDEE